MSEWQQKYLKDIVDIRVSNVDKKIYPNKSFVKLCNYMDAYSNDYITSKISFSAGSADANEVQRFGLKINDVMITKDSETPEDIAVSSVVIEELENVVCGYHLAILRPVKDELDGKFLMLKLKQPELKNYFYSVANGSTRYGLTIGNIESAKIQYPTLPEQQQIARILSTCDTVIEKTQAAIDKYKAIKQGMLHDLFTRGIDINTGKLRPKYEEAPELYKESKLGIVPKEWEVETLENSKIEIIDGDRGINYPKDKDFSDSGYCLFLSANNVSKDGFRFEKCQFITNQKDGSLGTGKLKREDIIVTTRGTVGNVVYYGNNIKLNDIRINSGMIILRNSGEKTQNEFLFHYVKDYLFEIVYKKSVSGSAQPQLPIKDLKKFYVLYPGHKEQIIISKKLQTLNNELQAEQTYLHKLQQIKAGLMNDLLSGKKRVSVPEEALAAAN